MLRKRLQVFLAAIAIAWSAADLIAAPRTYDVVVYGGTSAGVIAAVQVTRMGHTVALIEPGQHLGGLTSGGLGWTDSGDKSAVGGISREFYQRIKAHYDRPQAWRYEEAGQFGRYRANDDAMWTFEPSVAEKIYEDLMRECKIPVMRGQRLDRENGVVMRNGRIRSITMESGEQYEGTMFIDATYEGDLMAACKVSFTVGRESNETYDETLNGVQRAQNTHKHRFLEGVDPYVRPGDASSGLLPGITASTIAADGTGDDRVQAYCFRMCMSKVPENRVPFPKPRDYDPLRYELLLRNFEAGDLRLPLKIDMMPNGKTDTNNNCAFSTDNLGMNYDYPQAGYQRRAEIIREHESYQKGLMWTLANHPRVPESIRDKMAIWGLAKDEFLDNDNWPHQIYVREARRMVSDYVLTEQDCRRQRIAQDSVGLGSYNMDSHNTQRYVTEDGVVQNEGDVQVSPRGAYVISYRSVVPKRGECPNLLVPVALSASHIAYGSVRMEPVFMILGQSTATAAVIALTEKMSVQEVPYAALRARLLADGQVLELPDRTPQRTGIPREKFEGKVLDDSDGKQLGSWTQSQSVWPYVNAGYLHDNNERKGTMSCVFIQQLKPGSYELRMGYTAHSNRATNVPVKVRSNGREQGFSVDQRRKPEFDQVFTKVATVTIDKPQQVWVTITNEDTDGYVVVDAIQWVRK